MTIRYTSVANVLPESKMRLYPTKVINILGEQGEKKYVHTGRFQDEEQARAIDHGLRATLVREGQRFTSLAPNVDAINAFAATLLE
ncbi:MAG: hypothetical protein CFE43_03095 [Burkholderiales bacterium PBB3]|nr:MAG: hypothetical protein CFE43_03095 [Burkholderiales bacterium PBB3]